MLRTITLELEEITTMTPLTIDYDGDAVILMKCTITEECAGRLENMLLHSLRQRNLTDTGIGRLSDYISHIGRKEFNRQLAALILAEIEYMITLTKEKSAELFPIIDGRC